MLYNLEIETLEYTLVYSNLLVKRSSDWKLHWFWLTCIEFKPNKRFCLHEQKSVTIQQAVWLLSPPRIYTHITYTFNYCLSIVNETQVLATFFVSLFAAISLISVLTICEFLHNCSSLSRRNSAKSSTRIYLQRECNKKKSKAHLKGCKNGYIERCQGDEVL